MYMSNLQLILRTIYLDPDVDDLLRDRAVEREVSKAELLRTYLQAGMKAVKAGVLSLAEAPLSENILVLRTCHVVPKIDSQLRVEAFHTNTSKNDLYRRYIALGIRAADAQGQAPKAAAKRTRKVAASSAP